jgi:hypothetical protein
MATLANNAGFVYASLPDPATHIRLLEIISDPTSAPGTRISVSVIQLDSAPPYHAVSYTWGAITDTEHVVITEGEVRKRMSVRSNCADVLRQLAHFQTTRYYWVDALSINQSDAKEKGYQVGMMGEIFSRAECVLVCLGEKQGDDNFLVGMLNGFDRHLAAHNKSTATFMLRGRTWGVEESTCLEVCEEWLEALSDENTLRLCRALDELAQHPYFKRVWVLQELFLAQRIHILLGLDELKLSTLLFWWRDSKLHWFSFRKAYDIYSKYTSKSKQPGILSRKIQSTETGHAYLEQAQWIRAVDFEDFGGSGLDSEYEEFLQDCALPIEDGSRRSMKTPNAVVLICQNRHCLDPRDTVYGTLALADWDHDEVIAPDGLKMDKEQGTALLRPDYTTSSFKLAKEVMLRFNSVSEMWNVTGMLRLHYTNPDIMAAAEKRYYTVTKPGLGETEDDFIRLARQSPQNHILSVEGGVQVTWDGPWKHQPVSAQHGHYTRIVGPNHSLHGVASAGVQCGDWLVPTSPCYGVVLRQSNSAPRYFDVIGRLSWISLSMPREPDMTAFMIWFGVEDMLVHLVCGTPFCWQLTASDDPGEDLDRALSMPFCGEERSSFAEIPLKPRQWSEEDFRMRREPIRATMLEDWRHKLSGQQSNFTAVSHGTQTLPAV